MKKQLLRGLALICLACLLCGLMCGCKKKQITGDQAVTIVLESLDSSAQVEGDAHVHEETINNVRCYSVYLTVNGQSWVYYVSTDGKILSRAFSSHSH